MTLKKRGIALTTPLKQKQWKREGIRCMYTICFGFGSRDLREAYRRHLLLGTYVFDPLLSPPPSRIVLSVKSLVRYYFDVFSKFFLL